MPPFPMSLADEMLRREKREDGEDVLSVSDMLPNHLIPHVAL